MRQVRLKVNAYEKALVLKDGQLVRVLDSGRYWISPWVKVVKYDVTELFYHEIDLELLLKNKECEKRLVDRADNQIATQHKTDLMRRVLPQGKRPRSWKTTPSSFNPKRWNTRGKALMS